MTYRISEIMKVLKLGERSTRKLLVDTGARIAELDQNPQETVTREDLIALWADRADTREGRLIASLLRRIK